MENKDFLELKNYDIEDIEDVLVKIERSYNIKLNHGALNGIKTFGGLCDAVINQLPNNYVVNCTTQQAFYKLRTAIYRIKDDSLIVPSTQLKTIFPKHGRRNEIKKIESSLGFSLKLLHPKPWITLTFVLTLLVAIVTVFFLSVAWFGISLSIVGFYLSAKFGNEFNLETVGQVAQKMTRENYIKSRRDSITINIREIEDNIRDLYVADLGIDISALTRDATFV